MTARDALHDEQIIDHLLLETNSEEAQDLKAALAIAASMGIGTAAVAATDPGFRENAQQVFITVVEAVTHGHSGRSAPAPARSHGSPQPPPTFPTCRHRHRAGQDTWQPPRHTTGQPTGHRDREGAGAPRAPEYAESPGSHVPAVGPPKLEPTERAAAARGHGD
ncbi:hypothetical protein AHiyo4_39450 [Arthrobacter sp. Hiyo4]|nr:hypothetical protein AHiyo4_39450 [Arthrobacter sp. Hiyo4]